MFKERKGNFSFDLLLSISKEKKYFIYKFIFIIQIIEKKKLLFILIFTSNLYVLTIC
jgi:hypothetical protein